MARSGPTLLVKSMPQLPITNASPVLRTDFTDDATWEAICDEMQQPSSEGFEANLELIDDRKFDGLSNQQLLAAVPKDYPHTFIVVVDGKAVAHKEHPVLIVNLTDGLGSEVGEQFRSLPSEIHGIENNLSISNMDFADFAGAVDGTGIFRGF